MIFRPPLQQDLMSIYGWPHWVYSSEQTMAAQLDFFLQILAFSSHSSLLYLYFHLICFPLLPSAAHKHCLAPYPSFNSSPLLRSTQMQWTQSITSPAAGMAPPCTADWPKQHSFNLGKGSWDPPLQLHCLNLFHWRVVSQLYQVSPGPAPHAMTVEVQSYQDYW